MTILIDVIGIKNNTHQLNALPIEESVSILFSGKPDLEDIEQYVSLSRIDDDHVWPSVGDPNYKQIQYVKERFGLVDYTFTFNDLDNSLKITPSSKLYTNSKYMLFIEKGLQPQYYTKTKPISVGNSSIRVITESSVLINEIAQYDIDVIQTSVLSNGQHKIRVNVSKNSVVISSNLEIDILSTNLVLNPSTSIKFNSSFPFISGEKFRVVLDDCIRLSGNKIQEISTFIDADVIKLEDNPSQRLEYTDILNFYQNNVFGQTPAPVVQSPTATTVSLSYIGLSTFILTFSQDIKAESVTPNSFKIDLSEAYGNYILESLGYYNPSQRYLITYKILSSRSIRFSVTNREGILLGARYEVVAE